MVRAIQDLDSYLEKKQSSDTTKVIILNPSLIKQQQKDRTCGYYAMSNVTDYWHKKCGTPFYYARKSDANKNENITKSLRKIGKRIIPGTVINDTHADNLAPIFDVKYFTEILNQVNYHTGIFSFDDMLSLVTILMSALSHGFPIIFPIDLDVEMDDGSAAHYITIFGFSRENRLEKSECFFVSDGQYYTASIKDIFNSCMNLNTYPQSMFVKVKKSWEKCDKSKFGPGRRFFYFNDAPLDNMRGKLVIAYPPNVHKEYLKLQDELQEKLQKINEINALFLSAESASLPEREIHMILDYLIDLDITIPYKIAKQSCFDLFKAIESHHNSHHSFKNMIRDWFIQGVNKENIAFIDRLLETNSDLVNRQFTNNKYIYPLSVAIILNQYALIKCLIKHGANIHSCDNSNQMALHQFLQLCEPRLSRNSTSHRAEIMETLTLLINEKSINHKDIFMLSPLDIALRHKSMALEFTQTLLDNGADIHTISPASMLHVFNNDISYFSLLVKHGYDIYQPIEIDNQHVSLLYIALIMNRHDIAKYLLQLGMDINITHGEGITALEQLLMNDECDENAIQFLIEHGATHKHTETMTNHEKSKYEGNEVDVTLFRSNYYEDSSHFSGHSLFKLHDKTRLKDKETTDEKPKKKAGMY